jgi:hypothetical protein
MRQRVLVALMAAAGVAGALTMAAAGPAAAAVMPASSRVAAAPAWGKAALLPGAGKLGQGADGIAVSCPSAGNCTAGGTYELSGGADQVFVTSERNGRWGTARALPGLAALNTKGDGELTGISCGSPGNCLAAGSYLGSAVLGGYVAFQRNWRWGKAESVPGLSTLNVGGDASVLSVSCGSAGSCAVGGRYLDSNGLFQAFLATMTNWHWASAAEVPGTATLNAGGSAELTALSCRQGSNCSAAGSYRPSPTTTSGFVVTEKNGHWGSAIQVPGLAPLNAGGTAYPNTLSCGSAGNCAVGGSYRDAAGKSQAFLATQAGGHWSKAAEARGTGALNTGGGAQVTAISCSSAGTCSAGGFYTTSSRLELFLTTERKGSWSKAIALPGILSHNKGSSTQLYSLSCTSAVNCSAGGYYENSAFREFAFVSTESGGHWGPVTEVPGLAGVSPGGDSGVSQVSCPSAAACVGVGYASGAGGQARAFYVRRT